MAGAVVVSSALVMAILPFKAAEVQIRRPVTLRRDEHHWIRVTEATRGKREFGYVAVGHVDNTY